mmetsp:Transcript_15867/g.46932  ORF Transcript_15867/g.46932 Transcript_15867/m.46932 type:complete len:209 (-) Transcript_15867:174-800(-)
MQQRGTRRVPSAGCSSGASATSAAAAFAIAAAAAAMRAASASHTVHTIHTGTRKQRRGGLTAASFMQRPWRERRECCRQNMRSHRRPPLAAFHPVGVFLPSRARVAHACRACRPSIAPFGLRRRRRAAAAWMTAKKKKGHPREPRHLRLLRCLGLPMRLHLRLCLLRLCLHLGERCRRRALAEQPRQCWQDSQRAHRRRLRALQFLRF